jgi:hypothetical protein
MKKILTIFLLICSLSLGAQTKWYVATTGSDSHGKGTLADPWLTLHHAADTVTGAAFDNDTIIVGAGTFTETAQIALGVKINVKGAGATSIITSANALNPIILGNSAADGTDGSQSVSSLQLDGDMTALSAILITARSNVKFHDLTIIDFVNGGIGLRGAVSGTDPTTNATGNEIYNCTISNSSTRSGTGLDGLIWISGQEGPLIHDNTLTQNTRAAGQNGNIVNAVGGGSEANSGFNIGVKYYNNKSYKTTSEGAVYNFHIESWDAQGWEIYDNEFYNGSCAVDIGGYVNDKGAYAYSFYIHNNLFARDALQAINNNQPNIGIDVESATSDVIIEKNHFKNLQWGIYHSLTASRAQSNVFVRYNIFENIGLTDNLWAGAVMIAAEGVAPAYTNLYYDNNTMTASSAFNVGAGIIVVLTEGSATNIYVRNNIIKGFYRGPIWIYTGAGQTGTLYQQNNQHNNTSDAVYYSAGETITNLVAANNQTGDPLFVSSDNFRLQVTSPCIDEGLDINLTTDYDGNLVGSAPDIGAFERGARYLVNDGKLEMNNGKLVIITR